MKKEEIKEEKKEFTEKWVQAKYTSTFFALEKFRQKYNEPFTKGGERDPRRLKHTTMDVAKACIQIYGKQLAKNGLVLCEVGDNVNLFEFADDLNTNNLAIAKKAGVSPRTVRTHIKKLINAGLIINKRTHGPVKNFDIRFNPKILIPKQFIDVEEIEKDIEEILNAAKTDAGIQWVHEKERQNSPPIDSTRNLNNKNNTVLTCLKGFSGEPESPSKDTSTGNIEKIQRKASQSQNKNLEKSTKKDTKVAPPPAIEVKTISNPPQRTEKVEKLIKKLALDMWLLAYKLIYTDQEFTEDAKNNFRTMLIPYFHLCSTEESVVKAYEQYEVRLAMAARYYSKNPGFDKLHPVKYFNPNYKNGFAGTKSWYSNYQKARVLKIRLSNVNKLIAWLNENPTLQNFKTAKEKVESYGNNQLTAQFLNSVSNLTFK